MIWKDASRFRFLFFACSWSCGVSVFVSWGVEEMLDRNKLLRSHFGLVSRTEGDRHI
jgi:hypothetical protein